MDNSESDHTTIKTKGIFIFFFLIGFLIYGNSLLNPFVADDIPQIVNNPLVHSLQNIGVLFKGSTFFSIQTNSVVGIYYRPLMMVIFNLIYVIFGNHPFPFHLLQLFLHITNVFLVFLIFKKFLSPKIALLLATIYLIHPINSESVLYISDLQDILFVFFGLSAVLICTKPNVSYKKIAIILGLTTLSLLSKETGFLFIPVCLMYFYLFNRKFLWTIFSGNVFVLFLYSVLRFGIAGIYFDHQGVSPIVKLSFVERLINIPGIIFHYLFVFVFPRNLALSQQWIIRDVNLINFYIPLIIICFLILSIFVLGLRLPAKNKGPYILFAGWFVFGMLLISQIYPLDMTVAERWFYFPLIGLLGLIGVLLQSHIVVITRYLLGLEIISFVIIVLLSVRTVIRSTNWHDPITLYEHDTKINTNSYTLENEYGYELAMKSRYSEAEGHFLKSIQLAPDWTTNWSNLGVLYFKNGDVQKAKQQFVRAIQNGDDISHVYLATIYIFYDLNFNSAEQLLLSSLEKYPGSALLWKYLALVEYKLEKKYDSIKAAENAYTLTPDQENYTLLFNLKNNMPIDLK